MTPTAFHAFSNELIKVAKPNLGTLLGQAVTATIKQKAKGWSKKASKLEALKALATGGRKKLVQWITANPNKALALAGAGTGAATAGEGNRLKGAVLGGGLGAVGGHVGGFAGGVARGVPAGTRFAKMKAKYPGLGAKELARLSKASLNSPQGRKVTLGGIAAGGLGGGLLAGRAAHDKTAMMGGMEQPAMGTGSGKAPKNTRPKGNATERFIVSRSPGKLKKTAADEAGETVQDVLSEMLRQSQYQPEPEQPFWADQGATAQESVDDPAYGHGKGLKSKKAKSPAMKTAQAFLANLTKQADRNRLVRDQFGNPYSQTQLQGAQQSVKQPLPASFHAKPADKGPTGGRMQLQRGVDALDGPDAAPSRPKMPQAKPAPAKPSMASALAGGPSQGFKPFNQR